MLARSASTATRACKARYALYGRHQLPVLCTKTEFCRFLCSNEDGTDTPRKSAASSAFRSTGPGKGKNDATEAFTEFLDAVQKQKAAGGDHPGTDPAISSHSDDDRDEAPDASDASDVEVPAAAEAEEKISVADLIAANPRLLSVKGHQDVLHGVWQGILPKGEVYWKDTQDPEGPDGSQHGENSDDEDNDDGGGGGGGGKREEGFDSDGDTIHKWDEIDAAMSGRFAPRPIDPDELYRFPPKMEELRVPLKELMRKHGDDGTSYESLEQFALHISRSTGDPSYGDYFFEQTMRWLADDTKSLSSSDEDEKRRIVQEADAIDYDYDYDYDYDSSSNSDSDSDSSDDELLDDTDVQRR